MTGRRFQAWETLIAITVILMVAYVIRRHIPHLELFPGDSRQTDSVINSFQSVLHRAPTKDELTYYVGVVDDGNLTDRQLDAVLLASSDLSDPSDHEAVQVQVQVQEPTSIFERLWAGLMTPIEIASDDISAVSHEPIASQDDLQLPAYPDTTHPIDDPYSRDAPYIPYHSETPYFKDNLNVGLNSDLATGWTALSEHALTERDVGGGASHALDPFPAPQRDTGVTDGASVEADSSVGSIMPRFVFSEDTGSSLRGH